MPQCWNEQESPPVLQISIVKEDLLHQVIYLLVCVFVSIYTGFFENATTVLI